MSCVKGRKEGKDEEIEEVHIESSKKNVYFYHLTNLKHPIKKKKKTNLKHIVIRWTQTDRIIYWLVCSSKKIYWLVWSRSLRFAHW